MTYTRVIFGAVLAIGLGALALVSMQTPTLSEPNEPLWSALRGKTPLDQEGEAKRMTPQSNTAERSVRNYPEQPPLIPHSIEGYQLDVNVNKCLSCHARSRTAESNAPMLSVTHFMDRDGQFLASVSPRRYFCTQCHVPQHPVRAPVVNTFEDIDTVLRKAQEKAAQ